jgi:hypothetical protein
MACYHHKTPSNSPQDYLATAADPKRVGREYHSELTRRIEEQRCRPADNGGSEFWFPFLKVQTGNHGEIDNLQCKFGLSSTTDKLAFAKDASEVNAVLRKTKGEPEEFAARAAKEFTGLLQRHMATLDEYMIVDWHYSTKPWDGVGPAGPHRESHNRKTWWYERSAVVSILRDVFKARQHPATDVSLKPEDRH